MEVSVELEGRVACYCRSFFEGWNDGLPQCRCGIE